MKNDNRPPGDDAQEVDVNDADVSATTSMDLGSVAPRRTAPPPLPPITSQPPVVASQPPQQSFAAPSPSMPPTPSMMPAPKRSPLFYVGLLVAFIVVGLGAGAGVAVYVRRAPHPGASSSAAPTATRSATVITIPTVEMDDVDAGP